VIENICSIAGICVILAAAVIVGIYLRETENYDIV